MNEQRQNPRAPLDIYLNKFVSGVPYMVRASDISREGIWLTQLIEPDAGSERIGLQFQLPGTREVIYAEGQIVREGARNAAVGQGVLFTLLTDHHRRLIERYVARFAHA